MPLSDKLNSTKIALGRLSDPDAIIQLLEAATAFVENSDNQDKFVSTVSKARHFVNNTKDEHKEKLSAFAAAVARGPVADSSIEDMEKLHASIDRILTRQERKRFSKRKIYPNKILLQKILRDSKKHTIRSLEYSKIDTPNSLEKILYMSFTAQLTIRYLTDRHSRGLVDSLNEEFDDVEQNKRYLQLFGYSETDADELAQTYTKSLKGLKQFQASTQQNQYIFHLASILCFSSRLVVYSIPWFLKMTDGIAFYREHTSRTVERLLVYRDARTNFITRFFVTAAYNFMRAVDKIAPLFGLWIPKLITAFVISCYLATYIATFIAQLISYGVMRLIPGSKVPKLLTFINYHIACFQLLMHFGKPSPALLDTLTEQVAGNINLFYQPLLNVLKNPLNGHFTRGNYFKALIALVFYFPRIAIALVCSLVMFAASTAQAASTVLALLITYINHGLFLLVTNIPLYLKGHPCKKSENNKYQRLHDESTEQGRSWKSADEGETKWVEVAAAVNDDTALDDELTSKPIQANAFSESESSSDLTDADYDVEYTDDPFGTGLSLFSSSC